ncbi:MAG: Zn-dependent hydrolase [Bacteroidales bacterium]|nr:Zn-dependent hydrolase [Bacteroidales bacterium]
MSTKTLTIALLSGIIVFYSCKTGSKVKDETSNDIIMKLNDFAAFELTTDMNKLNDKEKEMIPVLIEAAKIMEEIFWMEAYGDKEVLLSKLTDENLKKYVMINYGPWERLNDNKPFIEGVGEKPLGANFYPADMTKEEFEAFEAPDKASLYTLIRRDEGGALKTVPYHVAFGDKVRQASDLIKQASGFAEDPGLQKYLKLRAEALLTDEYYESDLAWMDMKTNKIDFVVGPIETYEDRLFGYKAAHEAYVLVKDMEWSDRLAKYAGLLPQLQRRLPVDEKYKQEMPGTASDLNAYDVIYYAGDCNAGSKTIAINLPNDEKVTLAKGSRRLQLKNSMQAKFDKILVPIANVLIVPEQLEHIRFDAFFANTMFHEVAHGLGVMNTVNDKGTVREALKEHYTVLEEGKADIVGLFLVTTLKGMNEIETDLMDNYVTFLAGIFRSVRFGASSAHGKANLVRFNYFKEKGAFAVDEQGRYSVNFDIMQDAVNSLSELIISIQGEGDYQKAAGMVEKYGVMDNGLKSALQRVEEKDIPVDIVFEQGLEVLGLK